VGRLGTSSFDQDSARTGRKTPWGGRRGAKSGIPRRELQSMKERAEYAQQIIFCIQRRGASDKARNVWPKDCSINKQRTLKKGHRHSSIPRWAGRENNESGSGEEGTCKLGFAEGKARGRSKRQGAISRKRNHLEKVKNTQRRS